MTQKGLNGSIFIRRRIFEEKEESMTRKIIQQEDTDMSSLVMASAKVLAKNPMLEQHLVLHPILTFW